MDEGPQYMRPGEVSELLQVTPATLVVWEEQGKIRCHRTKGGHRRYYREDFFPKEKTKRKICYARVSSKGQGRDLEQQIEFFQREYPNHEYIKDIGSGLKSKRKGFRAILESAISGELEEVVVTHQDRLCRFNYDLVEFIIKKYSNGRIVVLDRVELSPEQELTNDLISVITSFSGRLYGLRSHSIERKIREAIQNPQNENISERRRQGEVKRNV